MTSSTYNDPSSLGALNNRLAGLEIHSQLTPASLAALYGAAATAQEAGRDRLMKALRLASQPDVKGSLNAVAWLQNQVSAAIKKAGEVSASTSQQQQRKPPPAPQRDQRPASAPSTSNVAQFDRQARQRARAPEPAESHDYQPDPDALADDEPPSSRASAASNPTHDRLQIKVFGRRCALTVESDITRGDVPTVRFELATAISEKVFDWKNKLTIQLTQDEIIEAAAVLYGFAPKVEFRNHGEDAKWLSLENQGKTLCVRGGNKHPQSIRLVPVGVGRATALTALVTAQLDKSLFGVGAQGALMTLLSRVAGRMMTSESRQAAHG